MSTFDSVGYVHGQFEALTNLRKSVNLLSSSNISNLQRVPISLRRRAASHNIKRIPCRYRNFQDIATKTKSKKICAKYRKICIKKNCIYKKRSKDDKKWLPTHIWHTKRYKMINKWNWKIPEVPNLKCFRPRMKQLRKDCCAMDISYNTILKIEGLFNETLVKLLKYIGIDKSLEFKLKEKLLNSEELLCMLHSMDEYPLSPICPARILCIQNSDNKSKGIILITIHPISEKSVIDNLKKSFLSIEIDKNFGRFRLVGANSHEVILKLASINYQNTELINELILKRSGSCFLCKGSLTTVNTNITKTTEKFVLAMRVKYTATEMMLGGWDLLFPIQYARELWQNLIVQFRCYSIGWKYYCRFMSIEYDSLYAVLDCFPDVGFPDCPDSMEYKNKVAIRESYKKKVIRIGQKLQYEFDETKKFNPYLNSWKSIRQTPDNPDSQICVLRNRVQLYNQIQPILLGKLESNFTLSDATLLIPVTLVNRKGSIEGNCGIYAPLESDTPDSGPINIKKDVGGRNLIGYTEIGDICLSKSYGKGFGLLALHLVLSHLTKGICNEHVCMRDNTRFVYVKKLNGQALVPCFLKVTI